MKCCVRMGFFSPKLFEHHSRGCKKLGDLFEDIYVTSRGIAESRRVNQSDTTAV